MPISGITNRIPISLSAGPTILSVLGTTYSQLQVELIVNKGGRPFDCTAWSVLLWYGPTPAPGDEQQGISFTGTCSLGKVVFDIPAAGTATHGRFNCQIIALDPGSGEPEEWGRGSLFLQDNPALEYLPIEWDVLPFVPIDPDTGDATIGGGLILSYGADKYRISVTMLEDLAGGFSPTLKLDKVIT